MPLHSLPAPKIMKNYRKLTGLFIFIALCVFTCNVFGSEAGLRIPDIRKVTFSGLGGMSGLTLMYIGILICMVGAVFGLVQYVQTKKLPVHQSMGTDSNIIWETCKTYLFTQGKFLAILWGLIALCM